MQTAGGSIQGSSGKLLYMEKPSKSEDFEGFLMVAGAEKDAGLKTFFTRL